MNRVVLKACELSCLVIFILMTGCGFRKAIEVIPVESVSVKNSSDIEEESNQEITAISVDLGNTNSADKENGCYLIHYCNDTTNYQISNITTKAISGIGVQLRTIKELGFQKENCIFEGWRIFRTEDNSWFLTDQKGNVFWSKIDNGVLPDGCSYALRGDKSTIFSAAQVGDVYFYAQWGEVEKHRIYDIYYYVDISNETPSTTITSAVSGINTRLETIDNLQFSKEGYVFEGWRIYRDEDKCWYLKNREGKEVWISLENGQLPEGYTYALRNDGANIYSAAQSGIVKLYAQWKKKDKCKMYSLEYYSDIENGVHSQMNTECARGVEKKILSLSQLGFSRDDYVFEGWRIYREEDNSWFVKNEDGTESWIELQGGKLPVGYTFALRGDEASIFAAANSGKVYLFAQWIKWDET